MYLINRDAYISPVSHLLSGGLLIGAFFIATDPVTSPLTTKGRWIFGIGVGTITMLIRVVGAYPEGVMFAVLLMNSVTPLINRLCKIVPAGGKPNV
jgi:electron transport complex protein RnfD